VRGDRLRRLVRAALLLVLAACGGDGGRNDPPAAAAMVVRVITIDLWAGAGTGAPGVLPAVDRHGEDGTAIRGPLALADPVDGTPIQAYERVSRTGQGERRQLLAVDQGGAGLGRVLDDVPGQPEKRYTGDVVFPLGLWRQGEARRFEATELTLFGPAARRITVEIVDIDHVHQGVPNSLSYRLTIEDAAGRVLSCEHSVYSPGRGLVAFRARGHFDGCDACPCPG
jgi:hypothetical protein